MGRERVGNEQEKERTFEGTNREWAFSISEPKSRRLLQARVSSVLRGLISCARSSSVRLRGLLTWAHKARVQVVRDVYKTDYVSSPATRPLRRPLHQQRRRIRHRRHQNPPQTVAQVLRLRRRAPPHPSHRRRHPNLHRLQSQRSNHPNERRHCREDRFDQRHHHPTAGLEHDPKRRRFGKNPNYASFRYQNTTTTLYYRGAVIGEARGPPGRAKARRTMRMNVTVDVITDRVLNQPDLGSDINSGLITMSSYTVVGGRVKIFVVKKHVTVRMNCSMTVNITSRAIQQQKCKRKVKL
ncbi:hypothetical protein DH2020_023126 [Rehmannia glutinosa]|uniref:Late embryogenesis abundant protein LEA-2 subgroup domain-containing protein n=1 Tax=Rehmannia glutinosa TaxID=99300 RepID=A0ABR0W561_REHGL